MVKFWPLKKIKGIDQNKNKKGGRLNVERKLV